MARQPLIIRDNQTLHRRFAELGAADTIVGRVSTRPGEDSILLDLLERGVRLIPSALSQAISRRKTMQAKVFGPWMPPLTTAVYDIHQLLEALALFPAGAVVTKQDGKNAGLGVQLWQSVEEVYSLATLGSLPFPFVLQPFYKGARDIRVIIIGDYVEAYERHNGANFRHNLHCGGTSSPCELSARQQEICRQVMIRGKFPYAHLDLMVSGKNNYLIEINLRGGIRGAQLSAARYKEMTSAVHEKMLKAAKQLTV
jgi:ribosomal protein S6--L-glutamate ligase